MEGNGVRWREVEGGAREVQVEGEGNGVRWREME